MQNSQLPRFCRLTFNPILLTQTLNRLFVVCAVVAFFIESFVVTLKAAAGTLDDVRSRDKLICGVSEGLPGFSEKDGSGAWRGFDVDFCKDRRGEVYQVPLMTLFESRHAEVEVQRKLLALQRDLAKARAQLAFKPVPGDAR